ncbi:MAG: hypothetical protein JWQ47_2276 [Glaciihabitans sp.]|nr:hypothetical protein [Glaciihabitans sp.]
MTRYVKNEEGGIHSVTDEHFENVLHETTAAGNTFILPGWSEISEAEARKAHPQLFGRPDPSVTYTVDELHQQVERKQMLDELYAPDSAE